MWLLSFNVLYFIRAQLLRRLRDNNHIALNIDYANEGFSPLMLKPVHFSSLGDKDVRLWKIIKRR